MKRKFKIAMFLFWIIALGVTFLILHGKGSPFAMPSAIWLFGGSILLWIWTNTEKCPKCNNESQTTRIGGTKYHQYYCKSCKANFWKPN
jgi:hypothetical protein